MPGGPEMPAFEQELPQRSKFPRLRGPGGIVITLIVVAGLALVTVGLGRFVWGGLRMEVGEPYADGSQLKAKFSLHAELFGYPSDGFGGACMVGDIAPLMTDAAADSLGIIKGSCVKQDDCNAKNPPWHGYCLKDPGGQGRCWYKPGEKTMCKKSGYYPPPPNGTAWPIGTDVDVPYDGSFNLNDFYRDNTGGKAARWRLIGLLRGTDGSIRQTISDPACVPAGAQC